MHANFRLDINQTVPHLLNETNVFGVATTSLFEDIICVSSPFSCLDTPETQKIKWGTIFLEIYKHDLIWKERGNIVINHFFFFNDITSFLPLVLACIVTLYDYHRIATSAPNKAFRCFSSCKPYTTLGRRHVGDGGGGWGEGVGVRETRADKPKQKLYDFICLCWKPQWLTLYKEECLSAQYFRRNWSSGLWWDNM